MAANADAIEQVQSIGEQYKYGFVTDIDMDLAPKGLNEDIVRLISEKKDEPAWMLEWRLKAYRHWLTMEEPDWQKVKFGKIDYRITPLEPGSGYQFTSSVVGGNVPKEFFPAIEKAVGGTSTKAKQIRKAQMEADKATSA